MCQLCACPVMPAAVPPACQALAQLAEADADCSHQGMVASNSCWHFGEERVGFKLGVGKSEGSIQD